MTNAIVILVAIAIVLSFFYKGVVGSNLRAPIWGFLAAWGMVLSMGAAVVLYIIYLVRLP